MEAHHKVLMLPDLSAGGEWHVFKPNGAELDISASKTKGLQEAIDYAVYNGWDLHVYGGGINDSGADHRLINCDAPIVFPPMQGNRIDIGSVSIGFPGSKVTGPAMIFDSCMMVNFSFHGQIMYEGNDSAVKFYPRNPLPADAINAIIDSRFYFGTITSGLPGTGCRNVKFDPTTAGISRTLFEFGELNGGGADGRVGIEALDGPFFLNTIRAHAIHGYDSSGMGMRIGTSNGDGVKMNDIQAIVHGENDTGVGAHVFGSKNQMRLNLSGPMNEGVKFESSASDNKVTLMADGVTTPVNDLGTNNTVY